MKAITPLLYITLFLIATPVTYAKEAPIPAALKNIMVKVEGGKFADYKIKKEPQFYAFYFSAHWCPPCRKFTPKLVDFYNQMKRDYDNFEIIFVSNDRSEEAMLEYMEWGSMPWPAVRFQAIFDATEINKYAGPGIPSLVVVDKDGNILANSFIGNTYVGPSRPMEALRVLIKKEGR